jgi:[ribosomal protein S5]-alanine N-acetyltransferase
MWGYIRYFIPRSDKHHVRGILFLRAIKSGDSPMIIPVLETAHLILRPLREADFADYFEYAQDPAVASGGMWTPYETEADALADFTRLLSFYPRGFMWWALEAKDDGKMIGRCQLDAYDPDDARAELSYALHQRYWQRGYTSEAVERIMRYGFDDLKLNRIGATVFPDNVGSTRILEKQGMIREGCLRQYRATRGVPEDVYLYGVLRPEWQAKHP